jgi:arabinan endo-1,5-alpha-L-arabinosidase
MKSLRLWLFFSFGLALISCGGGSSSSGGRDTGGTTPTNGPLDVYTLTGATTNVHDPAIIRESGTYYVFSTGGTLGVRCSSDGKDWRLCGTVFSAIPSWVREKFPSLTDLWAPEVSFFNNTYHLYYAASTFGSQRSAIGLATKSTLDPSVPWEDRGPVLETYPGDDANAIDPSVLVDSDGSVWLTYGSYWSGIKQRRIDPATGALSLIDTAVRSLATRVGTTAIEAASLVHAGDYYYLFVSFDACCQGANSTYRIMVGRSSSPNGPFKDQNGTDMLAGGGTQVLVGNNKWAGPGGQTVYTDPVRGDVIAFHAYSKTDGVPWLHVNAISWVNGWPVIQP